MPGQIHKLALLGLLLAASGFAQAPPPPGPGVAPKGIPVAKPSAGQPQPAPQTQTPCVPPGCTPPVVVYPPTPEQMAPVAPHVIYKFGQLSIVAENSTLGSILSAVRTRTGAQIDMPPDAANDRVAAQLGPGNPRDVLASLLAGSRFDYIVLGSPTDPDALAQVILTPRAGSGGAPNTAQAMPAGNAAEMPPRPAGGAGRPEITGDDDEGAEAQPEPQPAPQPVIAQPMPPTGQLPPGVQPGGQGQQQNPNQVKSPEQLLLELQKMQQQNQQQQPGQQPPRPRGQQQQN